MSKKKAVEDNLNTRTNLHESATETTSDIPDCSLCKRRWRLFFGKWTIYGTVLILIALITECFLYLIQISLLFSIVQIIANLLKTVGIALLIAGVFDFSRNSQSFVSFVSSLLSNVVVSKTFLKRLSLDDKRKALEMILQPSDDQIRQQTNIYDFFQKKLNESMNMFNTNIKTNLVTIAEAFKKDGRVVVSGSSTNRFYKINNRYQPIVTIFENEDSYVSDIQIIAPDGSPLLIEFNDRFTTHTNAGINYKKYEIEIPEKYFIHQYLTIKRKIFESGFDHWKSFHWASLTPCDGIIFSLNCHDNLVIKEHAIFDQASRYSVTQNDDKTTISIIATSWLDAYTGFTMTIGEKSDEEEQSVAATALNTKDQVNE